MPAFMSNERDRGSIAVAPKRDSLQRAHRPDGVDGPSTRTGAPSPESARARDPRVALRQRLDGRARGAEHAGKRPAASIDGGLVRAGGFQPHQRLDHMQSVGEVSLAKSEQVFHVTRRRISNQLDRPRPT